MSNYPVPYQSYWGTSNIGQQMYPQMQQQATVPQQTPQMSQANQYGPGLKWVDGEVGAKAFQMPQGWPANQPIDLWDTNDTVIYLKSVNQFGMPNPLQKAHYTLEDGKSGVRTNGYSGDAEKAEPDMAQYVRKDDMERMKQELMDAISSVNTSTTTTGKHQQKGEG